MRRTRFGKIAYLLLLTSGLLLATVSACRNDPNSTARGGKPVVRMGAVPSAFYLPIFVVQEQGLLKKRGYESTLEVFNANTNMMDSYLAGNIDVAAQSSGTMFPLQVNHPELFRFVYGQNSNSYSFIVKTDSRINTLAELEGKKIATWNSPTAKLAIELCLQPFFDPKHVEIRQVDFKLLNQVLEKGEVDAVFGPDVFPAQAVRSGGARYLEKNPLPKYVLNPFFNGGGFINTKLTQEKPEMAAAIKASFEEAIEFINSHNEEARKLSGKYIPAEEQDLRSTPIDEFIPNQKVDIAKAQQIADIFFEKGLMKKKIDVAPLFYNK